MAQLVKIIETADAITAEALAYVWEEYNAPHKRIPRVRPVAHPFNISIPKVDETAAPLAFVVEHFPRMADYDMTDYRPGYDQPVRYYASKFYTPARFVRHCYYSGNYTDAHTELDRAVSNVDSIGQYMIEELTAQAARDEIRADKWHQWSHVTAESVNNNAADSVSRFIVICDDLWTTCDEPTYVYHSSSRAWRSNKTYPAYIDASTDRDTRHGRAMFGALDYIPLTLYHSNTGRLAYIDVKRPDLVTIDSTRDDLQTAVNSTAEAVKELKEEAERIEKQLKQVRAGLKEKKNDNKLARANLAQYNRDPMSYYRAKLDRMSDSAFVSIRANAARARAIIKEA